MNIKRWLRNRKIAVIYGGRSAERKISLLTGSAILKSLKGMGFNAVGIDAGTDLPTQLKNKKIDFAYIALHGPWGEDGTVQGMLEIMDIPYSGCGVAASALTMNKIYAKMVFDSLKLPTPEWTSFNKDGFSVSMFQRFRKSSHWNVETLKHCNYPLVVKPASQGSAIGISIVRSRKEFAKALKLAFRYGKQVIIEKFIKGTEITVGVLGGKALPAVEIVPKNAFYDFESKYKPGMSSHIIPPRLPAGVVRKAQALAVRAFDAFGCAGVSRIDIIIDRGNNPWLLEVNTIPGMTETSLIPDEARAAGVGFGELVLRVIELSLKRRNR